MSSSYRHHKGSRRGEAAPTPEYDPHLLSPSYSPGEQYSAQQTDPYPTGQYYDGLDARGQDLGRHFSQLNVDDQPPEDGYYTYQYEQDPAATGQISEYDSYYGTRHPRGDISYQNGTSDQPMSEFSGQTFDDLLQQAQADAYAGDGYPSYGDEGASGPSSGPYGSPDAPLDTIPEQGFFPAQSRDGSQEEIDMSQFRVEWSSEFTPGTIFKVMWSEPRGSTSRAPRAATQATQRVEVTPDFYAGIRRFIVVTSGDGNSSCVPILTYERRACTKNGVNPKTHGIIYGAGHNPKPLRQEPKLGYKPVAVDLISGERLASESRVNYAKIHTIEHNVKVRIIGRVVDEHLDEVRYAVDKCWQRRVTHNAPKKHKSKK